MDLAIDKFSPDRFGLITGSACSVLFPKRSSEKGQDTYAKKLAMQHVFKFYDEQSTWQTEHGNMCEHEAFEYYQKYFDKSIEKGYFKSIGNCAGTCDAISENYGIDFKCPTTLQNWLDYLVTDISTEQYYQAQMYMYIFDKPKWKICAYLTETLRMGELGLSYPVEHNKRMIVIEVEKEQGWSDLLVERSANLIELRDKYIKVFKERAKNDI